MIDYVEDEYQSGKYRDYVDSRAMKLRHFAERLKDIGSRVRKGRLLDVGCSCGYFMEVAASQGFDVRGVEFTTSAIAAAAPHVRPRIVAGTIDAVSAQGPFDVITAFDLIEHLPDPRAFIRQCWALLAPAGVLVISTPDTGHFLRGLMRSRWPMLQPMQHLPLFSRQALRTALASEGFRDINVETAYKTLSPDYLINQIKSLNPVLSTALHMLSRPIPGSVLRTDRRINIGEMLAIATRS